MNTTRLYAAAVAFLLVAPMSLVSHAQKASAQATFAKAFDAYQAFDCEQALRLFAKGVSQSPDPKAYYFMGNCERWRLNRAGAEAAYDNGLKLAPEGSPVRTDLESAKASLAVAFDPALQTKLFYEAAQRMGIELPEGLQAVTDPRLVPVHLDWEWEQVTTSAQTPKDCPYYSNSGPLIFRIIGGITTSTSEFRCNEPEKDSIHKIVSGFGFYATVTYEKWDRKNPNIKGMMQYRDATGWKYVRGRETLSTSSMVTPPQAGWITYQETKSTSIDDSTTGISRCQYKPSTNAEIRRLSDGPQLEVLCASKGNSGSAFSNVFHIDLVSGMVLDSSFNIPGIESPTSQISGHIGLVGDTLTRVEASNNGSSSTTKTTRLTRTR